VIELHFVVEGQSEEAFVRRLLVPHLAAFGVHAIPTIVATRRDRDGRKRRGGGDWEKWAKDIQLRLRDKRDVIRVTTLFDLYGLPKNFPELNTLASVLDTRERCDKLQAAMAKAVADARFIPYLQRHEFEALVLAGLPALGELLDQPEDKRGFESLQADIGHAEPEDVNDDVNSAPSKRLGRFIPSYDENRSALGKDKPFFAEQVTVRTGLEVLRTKCPRFGAWVQTLEALGEKKS
jgi:hypothetical protein